MLLSLWLMAAPAEAAPAWTILVPFGVPQFTHRRRGRGFVFGGLQAVGLTTSTFATLAAFGYADAGNEDLYLAWRLASAGTVAFTAAAWFASVIDGSRLHQLELEAYGLAQNAQAWDLWHQPPFTLSTAPTWGLPLPVYPGVHHGG